MAEDCCCCFDISPSWHTIIKELFKKQRKIPEIIPPTFLPCAHILCHTQISKFFVFNYQLIFVESLCHFFLQHQSEQSYINSCSVRMSVCVYVCLPSHPIPSIKKIYLMWVVGDTVILRHLNLLCVTPIPSLVWYVTHKNASPKII